MRTTKGAGTTTIKVSVETRDRIRDFGGATHEETIIAGLDALETERFWEQAEAAAAWRATLPPEEQTRIRQREADLDKLFDGIR